MGPLHVACLRNQLACLRLLLAAGANVELQTCDRLRARPLHVAAGAYAYGVGLPGVQALLEAGADPTAARADGAGSAPVSRRASMRFRPPFFGLGLHTAAAACLFRSRAKLR